MSSYLLVFKVEDEIYLLTFLIIIIDNPSVKVLGNLAFGVFDGKITDNDEVYYIEPSDRLVQYLIDQYSTLEYTIIIQFVNFIFHKVFE